MAFRCEQCRRSQPAGTKPIRTVFETRRKEYPEQQHVGRAGNVFYGPPGVGWEIARELLLCSACATRVRIADELAAEGQRLGL